jgi:GNAT superfamily N-acetyltransferase
VIRLAGPQDLPDVADGIVALRGETVWKHLNFEPNRDYILGWLWQTLSTDGNHALFVAEQDGAITGFIGGQLTTEYFVPDKPMLTEWAWYVKPASRGTRLGWQLWQELMAWARARGAVAAVRTKALPVADLTRPRPFEQRIWMSLEAAV